MVVEQKLKPAKQPKPTNVGEAFEELLAATHQLEFALSNTETFGDSGLSFADLFVLRVLTSNGEMRIGQMANATRLSRQRLNRILRQLETNKLISVKADEKDARVRMVQVSDAGKKVLSMMREQLHSLAGNLEGPLPTMPSMLNASRVARQLAFAAWKKRKPLPKPVSKPS